MLIFTGKVGDKAKIKRSNGRTQETTIAEFDEEHDQLRLEWHENGARMCKHVDLQVVWSLNPKLAKLDDKTIIIEEDSSDSENSSDTQQSESESSEAEDLPKTARAVKEPVKVVKEPVKVVKKQAKVVKKEWTVESVRDNFVKIFERYYGKKINGRATQVKLIGGRYYMTCTVCHPTREKLNLEIFQPPSLNPRASALPGLFSVDKENYSEIKKLDNVRHHAKHHSAPKKTAKK